MMKNPDKDRAVKAAHCLRVFRTRSLAWFVSCAALAGACHLFSSSSVRAQGMMPQAAERPYPSYPGYGATPPNPAVSPDDDMSSFSIAIPGGGDIEVNGPPSEPAQIRSPLEGWSTQRSTPFSVGGVPLGPAPPR